MSIRIRLCINNLHEIELNYVNFWLIMIKHFHGILVYFFFKLNANLLDENSFLIINFKYKINK